MLKRVGGVAMSIQHHIPLIKLHSSLNEFCG